MAGMVRPKREGGPVFRLRPDLEIRRWDAGDEGEPRQLIHDPVTGSLDLLSWPETLMLPGLRDGTSIENLRLGVERQSTLRPTDGDVGDFVRRLGLRGWLAGGAFWPAAPARRREGRLGRWFGHYLYWRITLLRPDGFLTRTLPIARLLGSRAVIVLVFLMAAFGVYLALPRWEEFASGIARLAQWRNVPWILPAIAAVKLVHEFAHAYTAKAGGARVDGMGIALVMLLPLPFVDVTDAWRLPSRQRFRVAAAGVLVEAAVAGLALPMWALAPSGRGKDLCLVFATAALASTLATNLNPGVRFDGYYMLSHLLRVENLRARSTGLFLRSWRRIFWGIDAPDPEPAIRGWRRRGLAAYAVYSWLYRLTLFSAIALAVYGTFPKVFGLAMFAAVWWSFALRPLAGELAGLWTRRKNMGWRAIVTCLALFGLGAWLGMSLPRRNGLPAVIRCRETPVVSAVAGEVVLALAKEGDRVEKGLTLARVRRMETEAARIGAAWSAEEARLQADTAWLSDSGRTLLSAREARAAASALASEVWQRREDLSLVSAPGDGIVETWEPWIREGAFVSRGAVLGRIRHPGKPTVAALVDVASAKRYEPGQSARFLPASGGEWLSGTVVRIEPHRVESLDDGVLAMTAGGKWDGRAWRLPGPMNRMVIAMDGDYAASGQEGMLWITTRPYSYAREAWDWAAGLAMRESGM